MIVTRFQGALLIAVSLVSAAACWFAFATWLSTDLDLYREYTSAAPCPDGVAPRRSERCLRTVSFTVEGTRVKKGRNPEYRAALSGTPYWDGVVVFGDPGPLLEELAPGDRVTGTVWRGAVMTIGKGSVRQSTADEPRDEPQMAAALGTGAGLLAVLGLVFGTARLLRPDHHERFAWRPYGKRLLLITVIVCFVVGLLGVWSGIPWWLVPGLAVLLVAGGVKLVYGWDEQQGDNRRTDVS
ncbi:hypothetical protein [Streptomyces sp. NPDC088812]|uniref:hypothetical protein n=1 Tax=Streptomyces sp. NPDC088812 TaxID=3365905 RepID=UPI00380D9CAD